MRAQYESAQVKLRVRFLHGLRATTACDDKIKRRFCKYKFAKSPTVYYSAMGFESFRMVYPAPVVVTEMLPSSITAELTVKESESSITVISIPFM